jgi:hypothetical protein
MAGAVQPQSFIDTTLKFLEAKKANAAKIPMYLIDWLRIAGVIGADSERVTRIRGTASIIKLGADVIEELPKKAVTLGRSTVEFFKAPSYNTGKKAFDDGVSMVNPLADATELAQGQGIIHLSEENITLVKQVNGLSMLYHWGRTFFEGKARLLNAMNITPIGPNGEAYKNVAIRKEVFECAKAISYFVLGVFIVSSLIAGIAVPGIFFTAAVTSALIFTILGFYNENWGHIDHPKAHNWAALAVNAPVTWV